MRKLLFLLGILALTLPSCMKEDDITIVDFENFDMRSNTLFDITLRVENKSRKNVQLKDADVTVMHGGKELIRAILDERVVIPKKSTRSITLPLRIRIENPLALMSLVMSNRLDFNKITVSGSVSVKAGAMSRTFKQNDVPIGRHLGRIGIEPDEIMKQFSL